MNQNIKQFEIVKCSSDTLTFLTLRSIANFSISLCSSSSKTISIKVICSNPDNYIIKPSEIIISPGQSVKVKVIIKSYDNISEFNYIKNKIYIINQQKTQKPCLHVINIKIAEPLKKLYTQAEEHLKKLVKVQRYTDQNMEYKQFEAIMKQCNYLGNPSKIREFSRCLIVQFKNPVKLQPKLVIQSEAMFTMCYLSTFMGKLQLFEVGIQKQLNKAVDSIFNFNHQVICKTMNQLYIYQNLTIQPYKVSHSKFKITQIDPYLFIVIQKYKLYLYESSNKVTKIQTKQTKINCITSTSQNIFIAFQRYMNIGTTQVKSNKQEVAIMRSLKCLDFQNSLIICRSESIINILEVKNNFLFVYSSPTLYIFNHISKELLSKVEKQIMSLSILEGVFSFNYVNTIGVDYNNKLFKINIQLLDNFIGVEVESNQQKCLKVCISSSGYVYILTHQNIINYDLKEKRMIQKLLEAKKDQVFLDMIMNKMDELLVLKSKMQHKYIQVIKIY